MTIEFSRHFGPLANNFDAFILDIWGVLMDGAEPYPGAQDCLIQLRDSGKEIVLLSNAPRRASSVADRLAAMGIDHTLYDRILTSGEAIRSALNERSVPYTRKLGRTYLHIGPSKDQHLLEGLNYIECNEVTEADFILVTGVIDDTDPLEKYEALLKAISEIGIPMICANPDKVVVRQNGDRVLCAGAIAARYQEIGGISYYLGKPYREFYETCLGTMSDVSQDRILAVGDTLHTDIKGAKLIGLTTALVAGGVLTKSLDISWGDLPSRVRLEQLCLSEGVAPEFVIPAFVW